MEKPNVSDTMRELLSDLAQNNTRLSVFGLDPVTADKAVWEVGKPLLDAIGVAAIFQKSYRWYLGDLAVAFRSARGKYLVLSLESVLVKWLKIELDPELLEMLIACCVDNLPAAEDEVKVQNAEVKLQTAPDSANSAIDNRTSSIEDRDVAICAPEPSHAPA